MTEKNFLTKTLTDSLLTRRSFLKWSAVLGGTAALAGGVGYGLKAVEAAAFQQAPEGKWIPAACWLDCGAKGFNKAYVVDGVVVRMGTDNTIPDTPDCPQLKSCVKGRALRNWLLSAERLKYPMKRKNWQPGGGDKELRGRDEWVRISWDEALNTVASELKRTKDTYGNEAILANWAGTYLGRFLGLFGGNVSEYGGYSSGTWSRARSILGFPAEFNDRVDLRNSQLIVLWASNPVWSRAGLPTYFYLQAKKAGAKFIAIDPFYNPTAQVLADEWIPVRPATDHTLLLGMAHTLITEDDPENNPLIDWDFLNRCTVGFDSTHMPAGTYYKDNFRDYVLGTFDGIPKTPEWASEICGVPPEKIRLLAREIAITKRVAICMSPAPARVNNADSLPQAFMTFGCMTGHIGKSGSMMGMDTGHQTIGNGGPQLVIGGATRSFNNPFTRAPEVANPLAGGQLAGGYGSTKPKGDNVLLLIQNETWDAVLDGKFTAGLNDIRDIDIHLIYHGHGSPITQHPGAMKAIAAHRKVDFVVTQNLFFNPDAQYSDIVLPVTSRWERYGDLAMGFREQILWTSQVMEPYFEAKDDIWIARELGVRLGIDPKEIEPWSLKQELFNEVADATVISADGKSYEPLVTITDQDIAEFEVEGKTQNGRIPIKEFKEKGIYHVARSPGDNFGYITLKKFRDDPVANPVKTASGKLEIHSKAYADAIKSCGWSEISPIPTYIKPIEGYEDTFADWGNKIKGEFDLQLVNLHVGRRTHSNLDNAPWLEEAFPFEFLMNPIDAGERGIKDGDTVLVTSRHGKVLRRVLVTSKIIPGATAIGQGAWVDYDDETGIDMGGCANTLIGAIKTGQGQKGYNTCNVNVVKWAGQPLQPEHLRPYKTPLKEV